MIPFLETLKSSETVKAVLDADRQGVYPIQINGCMDIQLSHFISVLSESKKKRLIITHSEERASKILEELRNFDKTAIYYPYKDALFFTADVHGAATQKQRLGVIRDLITKENVTVVTTIDGCLDRLLPLNKMEAFSWCVKSNETLDLDKFRKKLVDLGYVSTGVVSRPGEYGVRGGIIDIFPMGEETPYRIELWDDEVDTIRSFDVESQRSIEQVKELDIFPSTELPMDVTTMAIGRRKIEEDFDTVYQGYRNELKTAEAYHIKDALSSLIDALSSNRVDAGIDSFITYFYDDTCSLIDYFKGENAAIYVDEPSWVKETLEERLTEFNVSMDGRLRQGYILEGQKEIYYKEQDIVDRLTSENVYYFSKIGYADEVLVPNYTKEVRASRTDIYKNHFEILLKDLKKYVKDGYRVIFTSGTAKRGKKLSDELMDEGLDCYFVEKLAEDPLAGKVAVIVDSLSAGFLYIDEKLLVVSEEDVIRRKKKRKKIAARYKGEVIKNFGDLSVGDYVVHEDRGVGIYRGIVSKSFDDQVNDYISIEYEGGAMYYINVSGMDKVQRYAGGEGRKPKLNKLGGKDWDRVKSKVKAQVGVLAKELVELYAIRQEKTGVAMMPDTPWQEEFEEAFPYEETEDQLTAIADVKRDMESTHIMDRLLCGDVGYGKTEVALRAAFKAVTNSKQVVYLVPTTVLCEQHFNTFTERMKDYPITVRMLSRFQTPKQVRETIEGLKKGEVDIVIGTHKVFSKNVEYKDLGLLIIDEEQRFGVTHKEKIKQMKKDVDVLTLSATPIPRTLHMSLSGIRDLSLLNEPPVNRRAIQTYVCDYNEELVKEAIKRELARGGQVYYVFNQVKNIDEMAQSIRDLVPQANVGIGHGQMSERELELMMRDFISGKIDVLVTTTIIETGIDIPNVNTIIIHNADRFGLSQLYQLRGRVGRSSRQAYAFLMYRRDKILKETAEKRLAAIREFTDLGSGFKIAMRDLEIRGSGNVLGTEQSGQMEAVGYDLYCKMLKNAIAEMRGEVAKELIDTSVEVRLTAYIPATYVPSEFTKLELYKRFASVATDEDYQDMMDELIDRFGEPPEEVKNLLDVALVKNTASANYITKIRQIEGKITITLYEKTPIDFMKFTEMLNSYKGRLRVNNENRSQLIYSPGHLRDEEIMGEIMKLVEKIGESLREEEEISEEEN